jgi:hypothetical protein
MIMKEDLGRFGLAYSLPLLEGDLYEDLRILGEGKLSEDVLQDYAAL